MARSDDRKVHWYIPKLVEQLGGATDRPARVPAHLDPARPVGGHRLWHRGQGLRRERDPAARAQGTPKGGVLKIAMRVPDLKNPHTFSWVYDSNICGR